MIPVSDRFLAAARSSSATVVTRVDVLSGGEATGDPLLLVDGQVTLDRNASIRGRCNLTVDGELPIAVNATLGPYGTELRVWAGFRYWDGTEELVPLITAPIQESDADLGDDQTTSITCEDRARAIAQAKVEDDLSIAAGTNVADAIETLIDGAGYQITYLFQSTSFTTGLLTVPAGSDRWEEARKLAKSAGCELFFDGFGNLVLQSVASTVPADPVWSVDAGGVWIGGALSLSRADTANRIIAVGGNSSTSAVWRSVATDDDPASPTYYDGQFGHAVDKIDVSEAASQAAVDAAAQAELDARRGIARGLRLSAVPNYALLPGDTIEVTRETLGISELDLIDAVTVGLSESGVQDITTRTVQQ